MAQPKRKDKSRVVLRKGEVQRANGTYHYCTIRKWFKSSKDGNVEQDCKGTWHSAGRIIL